MFGFALFVFAIAFALFWIHCFTQMMLFADSDFPGQYDKIIWGAAFIFLFFITPFAFLFWKSAYISYCNEERQLSDDPVNDQ